MRGLGPQGSDAEAARLTRQLEAEPGDIVARFDLAAELLDLDRPHEALDELQTLRRAGADLPEVATLTGHALVRLGQNEAAAEAYGRAVELRPEHVSAHTALAALLPQLGRGDKAFEPLDRALVDRPHVAELWIAAMQAAKAQRRFERLLSLAEAAERIFGSAPMISGFKVDGLAGAGMNAQAISLARSLVAARPDDAAAQATLAYVLLKEGDGRNAEAAASIATKLAPRDQAGWALLATAWRLLDDPREQWLCRYDELIIPVDIQLPRELEDYLSDQHRATASPADQSLRGGTQTPGKLFERVDPIIGETARRVAETIDRHLSVLVPEADHPFLSRLGQALGFSASWSVRLTGNATHENHIHPAGWLSSAMYVALPSEVGEGSGEGSLVFGVPDSAFGLDLAPRRIVRPREGVLMLFPSYLWHGTMPFRSDAARLTIAFDVVPVDNPGTKS